MDILHCSKKVGMATLLSDNVDFKENFQRPKRILYNCKIVNPSRRCSSPKCVSQNNETTRAKTD